MIIAGLQNLSLVDFPGHLAAAVFTQGCNFKCGYCQNPDLITCEKKFDYTEEQVFEYLRRRKEVLEGVVVSGGEPTINNDLPDFLEKIKVLDLKIKLDTNGSNPDMLEELQRHYLVDYIAIDIKTSLDKYHIVADVPNIAELIAESVRLTMLWTFPYEFRMTCVPGIVEEEDLKKVGQLIKGAKKFCLQQFRPVITYDKKYEEVEPYSAATLRKFARVLEEYVEEVEIRGL